MKINILQELKDGPWGGGNQFLKTLKNEFIKSGIYSENPDEAGLVLFNSFPFGEEYRFKQIKNLKKKGRIFIHRIDGPIFSIREKDLIIDKIIYKMNDLFADGTVFQSNWSREMNYKLGMKKKENEVVIINAPDPRIFNRDGKIDFSNERKIRLIGTSWSSNMRKGFGIYKYLDENLDFSKYEMTFVGNAPVEFKNIKYIKPLTSEELAKVLKSHDIFITASQSDPCSNSLIEALHCGLPAVVLNDGGHPEIVGEGGEVFHDKGDVLKMIKKVSDNYYHYQEKINLPSIESVSKSYIEFFEKIYRENSNKTYINKINYLYFYYILSLVYYRKFVDKLKLMILKVWKKIKK